jgi:hypothetical protein
VFGKCRHFSRNYDVKKRKPKKSERKIALSEPDFFSLAGIWKNRNITAQQLRQRAWHKKFSSRLNVKMND